MSREKYQEGRLDYLKRDAVQGFTAYLGLIPVSLTPGRFITRLKLEKYHSQQDGFAHAGVIATMADHTAGYASYSLIPEGLRILTIEYKITYFKPAIGDYLECKARVIKPGKRVLFTEAVVYSIRNNTRTLVAKASHTMAAVSMDKTNARTP